MNKAWCNYEKNKYKKRIQQKEESLQIHIKELDRLRAENKRLVKKLNLACVNGSISAGDAIMAILDWMKSDDCWIEDKNGNKLTDVEICGKFNPKYLEKYYR